LNQNAHPVDLRIFAAFVVCSLIAIFYIPTLIPGPSSASLSYLFGYYNPAGVVLLVLLVTIGAFWTRGLNIEFEPMPRTRSLPVSKRVLFWSLLAVFLGCLAMFLIAGRYAGFGESAYEINRITLLAQGKIPYADFEFAYGASFLYGPVILHDLLHINVLLAYHLFWLLNCLLGTVLLYSTVNLVNYPTNHKKSIFLLLFCAGYLSSVLSMGTHCTYLRFTVPLFFVLTVYNSYHHGNARWKLYSAFLALTFSIILLLISPETAIAHAFACAWIFFFSSPTRSLRSVGLFAGLLLAFALVFWAALKLPVLNSVKAFGAGADGLPIYCAPHILVYFAALFLCGCYFYRRLFAQRLNDNTFALVAYSIPMVAAALGRCDPYHVLLDGQGVFLASLFYLSNFQGSWKYFRNTYLVVLVILPSITFIWFNLGPVSRIGFNILSDSNPDSTVGRTLDYLGKKFIAVYAGPAKQAKWEAHLAQARREAVPETIDLNRQYPTWHGDFFAPFDYTPNNFGSYFADRIHYGKYPGFQNVYTIKQAQEAQADIGLHPERALLLPDYFEFYDTVDVPASRKMISMLFASPYLGKAVHPQSFRRPVIDYILSHYHLEQPPERSNFKYGLWVRDADKMAP